MKRNETYFVAEVSSNHHQDLSRCLRFIDAAALAGCGAVKFQMFRIDELFAPEILQKSEAHRKRRDWQLPLDFLPHLAAYCQEVAIDFSCTPFYLHAVEELFPYVAFYKIASYELLWKDLLRECAQTKKPVVLSTGMATMDEIAEAVETLRLAGCDELTLLHCVSGYPTPVSQCNLGVISSLAERFSCPVGWSDHSVVPGVIHRAVHRWGAAMVEFHLDLDKKGAEYAAGHCWLPDEIGQVIIEVKHGLDADGNGIKKPASCEKPDRDWRADPGDGLRPLKKVRGAFRG